MMHVGRGSSGSINRQWRGSNGRVCCCSLQLFECKRARKRQEGPPWLTFGKRASHGTVKTKKVMLGERVELGMTVDKRVEPVVDVVLGVEVAGRHAGADAEAKQRAKAAAMPRRDHPSRPARPSR
jgi:hypothetical protein